eukprot:5780303-Amphidinium_carterae.1
MEDPADGLVMPFLADSLTWHHALANEGLHDRDLDDIVHEATVKEISKGYMSSFTSQAALTSMHG